MGGDSDVSFTTLNLNPIHSNHALCSRLNTCGRLLCLTLYISTSSMFRHTQVRTNMDSLSLSLSLIFSLGFRLAFFNRPSHHGLGWAGPPQDSLRKKALRVQYQLTKLLIFPAHILSTNRVSSIYSVNVCEMNFKFSRTFHCIRLKSDSQLIHLNTLNVFKCTRYRVTAYVH